MAKAKRGRPSQGLSETRVEVRMPESEAAAVSAGAAAEGIGRAEWIRRAIRERALRQAARSPELREKMLGE